MLKVEETTFDSKLFGFKVGRTELSDEDNPTISDAIALQGALRRAYGSGIKLVYLFAPVEYTKNENARSSSPWKNVALPGIKVDDKTTFTAPLSSFNQQEVVRRAFSLEGSIRVVSYVKTDDPSTISPTLIEVALASGEWSRFRTDSNIPRSVFEGVFSGWIKNSVNRSLADEVFVAKDIASDAIVGLITLKMRNGVASIGLLAVSVKHRRRGIAASLLNRAVLWSFEQSSWNADGKGVLSVVTQGSNKAACACYESLGCTITSTQNVYHVWLPQHLEEPGMRADQAPIAFCKQFFTGHEKDYVAQVFEVGLDSAARFTTMCSLRLKEIFGSDCERVVMVPSGTAALEMAALLSDIQVGDEVIMPSYTFSSTANAFVLRGAVPVFVDVRKDTLNIDEKLIEAAITAKTKAICCVHYAGVPCEMDEICSIAKRRGLFVIEDAAQAFLSTYKGRQCGTIGDFGCFSFHYTKNIICGEGGAISVNRSVEHARRALILWEKGTNRYDFMAGKIDKYEWVDYGSSYVPSEVSCAILWAQLERATEIIDARVKNFNMYAEGLLHLQSRGFFRLPSVPEGTTTNAHIFYIILPTLAARSEFATELKKRGVSAFSHYVPLHASPAGRKFGRVGSEMSQTDAVFDGLLRLPLWIGLQLDDLKNIIEAVERTSALLHGM